MNMIIVYVYICSIQVFKCNTIGISIGISIITMKIDEDIQTEIYSYLMTYIYSRPKHECVTSKNHGAN